MLFNHSSNDGDLGYFHFSGYYENAIIIHSCQVFAWIYVFISVGYITRYEPYDKFYVYHLEELPTCLSRWHFTIPQATYESSNFSPLLSIPVVLIFATLVVSHCGSDLYFLNN